MNQRRVIGIVLILFMAIMGYLLLSAILQTPEESEQVEITEAEPEPELVVTVSIIRTKVPLYRGRVLSEVDFSIEEIPEDQLEDTMIRSDSYDVKTLTGAIALGDQLGNEVLRRDNLFLKSDGNPLHIFLEDGMQVVALLAGIDSRLNQALEPGDYVDVILSVPNPLSVEDLRRSDGGPLKVFSATLGQAARTVMKHKRVVAIGGRTFFGTILPDASEEYVLLEVTGKEAELLILAQSAGTLRFIFSRDGEDENLSVGTQATELFDIKALDSGERGPVVYRAGEATAGEGILETIFGGP